MTVYYNEFDPFAAAWLRELIKAGQIPAGDVDERDIKDVQPEDLRGYTQCHFFAGIGGWSYALRLAGWPDDRPVWTGSPPCQPFSTAGRGLGKADDRHLAPHFLELVAAVRPPVLFGEQVAAAVTKDAWLDDLLDALELYGYSAGAIIMPAAAVGAPHIRQRLWFYAGRKDVRPLQNSEIERRIRERLPLQGRVQECVSKVQESAAQGDLFSEIPTKEAAPEELGKRSGVCEGIQAQACSRIPDSERKEAGPEEGAGFRSGCTSGRSDSASEADAMRAVGNPVEDGAWPARLRFDQLGQDRPKEGLCDNEYQDSLLGDKCGSWNLGVGSYTGNNRQNTEGMNNEIIGGADISNEMVGGHNATRPENTEIDSVGAPHIRQRLWFVAERLGDSSSQGPQGWIGMSECADQLAAGQGSMAGRMAHGATGGRRQECQNSGGQFIGDQPQGESAGLGSGISNSWVAEPNSGQRNWRAKAARGNDSDWQNARRPEGDGSASGCIGAGWMAMPNCSRLLSGSKAAETAGYRDTTDPASWADRHEPTDEIDSPWRDPDWLLCRDGKWRPTQSEIFPLVDGLLNRMGILRGAGNAIVPQVAAEVIQAHLEEKES